MNYNYTRISYFTPYFQSVESDLFENVLPTSSRVEDTKTEIFVPQSGMSVVMATDDSANVSTSSSGAPAGQGSDSITVLGATMTNAAEAESKDVTQAAQAVLPRSLRSTGDDGTYPDIAMYLRKPIIVQSGYLSPLDVASTFATYGVFDPIKTNTIMWNKIVGVHSFRATSVFTLQVNATRFQAGRYILAYLPTAGAASTDPAQAWNLRMRLHSATQVTQLMHVELDLSRDTQVQLRVPYTCYANSTPVTKFASTFTKQVPGKIIMYPYMAMQVGSSATACSYTLWVHYEDVELYGNMAPQMGGGNRDNRGTSAKLFNGAKDVLGMEIFAPGPVEKVANNIRVIADSASRVPSLGALAAPVSWMADALGGVASMFGWSKPNIIEPVRNVHLEIFNTMPNCDAHEQTVNMALRQDNHIDILPGFAGTDKDELSIDYLKSIYAFWKVYTWTELGGQGDLLFKIPLSPCNYYSSTVDTNTLPVYNFTPVSFLAQMFTYYRGGLKFKFKLVKTEFHSGRLIFGFFPCDPTIDSTGAEVTYANLSYVQKTVIDVRDDVEWEIEIPWVSTTSWKQNSLVGFDGAPFGYLACYIQAQLISPDGVANDVKILTEVAGADDLAFAGPRFHTWAPIAPQAYLAAPQMGGGDEKVNSGVIGTAVSKPSLFNEEACCIGEVITSLRQLLKRPSPYLAYSNSKTLYFYPDQFGLYISSGASAEVSLSNGIDMTSVIASLFAFYRGSFRFNAIPINVTNITDIDSLVQWSYHKLHADEAGADTTRLIKSGYSSATAATAYAIATRAMGGGSFSAGLTKWGISFSTPFYNQNHSNPVMTHMASTAPSQVTAFTPGQDGQSDSLVGMYVSTVGNLNTTIMRHVGDDFNFGMFVGVPPMYYAALGG
jgi:hypothetical protein